MRVHSIFLSMDGEVNHYGQGRPSTFLRLAGCNQACTYCDVPDAQSPQAGKEMSIKEIVNAVVKLECPKVTITGGEPLVQQDFIELLFQLYINHLTSSHGVAAITVETNGSLRLPLKSPPKYPISFPRGYGVHYVVDYKLPSAGLNPEKINKVKYHELRDTDWIKFVIADQMDYEIAKEFIRSGKFAAKLAMSPLHDFLAPRTLLEWMLRDRLWEVTLNLQLHKYIDVK